jgi:hypothetical protein
MSATVQKEWETLRDKLLKELSGASDAIFRIPRWDTVSLDEALGWIQGSICEGFCVSFKIERSDPTIVVWLKKWEDGEDEPNWRDICSH